MTQKLPHRNQTLMDPLSSIPVLVVGGAGYIGSHTCKALKKKGYLPIIYDNLQNGHRWAASHGELIVGDLMDAKHLNKTIQTYQPKAVLHFASSIDCRKSIQDPASYYQNNVVGSLILLQALQKNNLKKLVFSSTAAVYGEAQDTPLKESDPCVPVNVYGHTKRMVEQMIQDFENAYGMRSVILRYFNAAGADPEGELGEAHHPETHLIPIALNTALGRQSHLEVFGDGSALRDYIHVMDLADAHVKAVDWLLEEKESMIFNLGTGKGHTLTEVVSLVEKVSGKPVKCIFHPKNPHEPVSLVADASLAKKTLQWKPAFSDLETIISTAYQWHLKGQL